MRKSSIYILNQLIHKQKAYYDLNCALLEGQRKTYPGGLATSIPGAETKHFFLLGPLLVFRSTKSVYAVVSIQADNSYHSHITPAYLH